jgi:hypothetical protein
MPGAAFSKGDALARSGKWMRDRDDLAASSHSAPIPAAADSSTSMSSHRS